jgi:hypothetical protein
MKIRYLKHHEIDPRAWDHCIDGAVNHSITGYSWYLDLICDRWDGLVADDYAAVFPLTFRKKGGIHYLAQPPFAQQLGPFFDAEAAPDIADSMINTIPKKFRFAEIFLNTSAFPALHQTRAHDNFLLDLSAPYPAIRAGYDQNLSRNLKKAEKHQLSVVPHPDIMQLITLFRTHRGATVHHWNEETYQRFRRLYHTAEHKGMARAWGVYNAMNTMVAGAVFFFDKQKALFVFSGLSDEGKEKGAMPLLIDHVINAFAETPMVLDFEGSMDPGLARFYQSFGATLEHYWFLRFNRLPFPFRQMVEWKRG